MSERDVIRNATPYKMNVGAASVRGFDGPWSYEKDWIDRSQASL